MPKHRNLLTLGLPRCARSSRRLTALPGRQRGAVPAPQALRRARGLCPSPCVRCRASQVRTALLARAAAAERARKLVE